MPSTSFSITNDAMRSSILALALVCIACSSSDEDAAGVSTHRPASAEQATDTTVINIRRPTLLALFPITQAEVDANADVGEAMSDFQQHLEGARDSLALRGVAVEERYTPIVRYSLANRVVSFAPPRDSVATYVWIAPDRPAHTHYGVLTDSDLLDLTNRFLAAREIFKAF